jgi:hypothetical protein
MLRRLLVVSVATLAAVLTASTTASAAVRPFGPPQTVAGGCGPGFGDAVVAADGSVRGFADCDTSAGRLIRFFSRTAGGTVNPSERTGFVGVVLGVAYDGTATYVLFYDRTRILIGKRTEAGAYSSRVVDGWSGGVVPPTGDVIARNGQWFGVWSEQFGPGGEFAQVDLVQAGSAYQVRRITFGPEDDIEPSLAYRGATPVMVWSRQQTPAVPGPADLRIASFVNGSWQSRLFASAGDQNYSPDLAVVGGLTFVAWNRDDHVVVAGNYGGSYASRTFNTPGYGPRVAASASAGGVTHVFVTWTVLGSSDAENRVFFAETASPGSVTGTWSGTYITGPGTAAFAVGAYAGKATVAYRTDAALYLRSQS